MVSKLERIPPRLLPLSQDELPGRAASPSPETIRSSPEPDPDLRVTLSAASQRLAEEPPVISAAGATPATTPPTLSTPSTRSPQAYREAESPVLGRHVRIRA